VSCAPSKTPRVRAIVAFWKSGDGEGGDRIGGNLEVRAFTFGFAEVGWERAAALREDRSRLN
jgi:hypothetical protein